MLIDLDACYMMLRPLFVTLVLHVLDAIQVTYIRVYKDNKTGVFVKHECPQWQQSPKLAIFSIKDMVKVTRSLTLVSFKRVSLVEYAFQTWSISYGSKVMATVKGFLPESETDRVRQTDRQTDRTKTRCPRIPFRRHLLSIAYGQMDSEEHHKNI